MVCAIADNVPLTALQKSLGLAPQCHSYRDHCLQGLKARVGDYALGIPGTAMGYCQALFNRVGNATDHTQHVIKLLSEIDAPWAYSHEMFWGYHDHQTPDEFVRSGMKPLLGNGRVPILITSLDPGEDMAAIDAILATKPPVFPGECMLIRLILRDSVSTQHAAKLIKRLLTVAREEGAMPAWWPLVQGDVSPKEWSAFAKLLGTDWEYVNVAVNPFTPDEQFETVANQVTVAQIPIGLAEDMSNDGAVRLAPGTRISGAPEAASYSLPAYMNKLADLSLSPTIIVLGPSLPTWTDAMNQQRIARVLPLIRAGCDVLWHDLEEKRRETVWRMSA